MRWFKPGIRNTISAFLGAESRAETADTLEPVRRAMLEALGDQGVRINPQLSRRIRYLADAQALWYTRSDMVAVLSELHGEERAVDIVQRLSPAFKGLLPQSLLDASRGRR